MTAWQKRLRSELQSVTLPLALAGGDIVFNSQMRPTDYPRSRCGGRSSPVPFLSTSRNMSGVFWDHVLLDFTASGC